MIKMSNAIQCHKYNIYNKYIYIKTSNPESLMINADCFLDAIFIFVSNKIPSVRSFL